MEEDTSLMDGKMIIPLIRGLKGFVNKTHKNIIGIVLLSNANNYLE